MKFLINKSPTHFDITLVFITIVYCFLSSEVKDTESKVLITLEKEKTESLISLIQLKIKVSPRLNTTILSS